MYAAKVFFINLRKNVAKNLVVRWKVLTFATAYKS